MKPFTITVLLSAGFSCLMLLSISQPAKAQGPPILTDTPIMLGLEGRAMMFRTIHRANLHLRDSDGRISDPQGRQIRASMLPLALPYNITPRFQVSAMLPLSQMTMDMAGNRNTSFGIGDLTLQAKQLLFQRDGLQRTFRVTGKLAAQLPSGNENADPPLGAGSYDAIAGVTAGWLQDRAGIYGDVSWAFFRSDFNGYRPGNIVDYNAAFGWRLLPAVYDTYPMKQVNLYLELDGIYSGKNRLDDQIIENTGAHRLFVAPGIQFIPSRTFLVELSVQLPVYQQVKGIQPGTDYIVSTGVRWLLW